MDRVSRRRWTGLVGLRRWTGLELGLRLQCVCRGVESPREGDTGKGAAGLLSLVRDGTFKSGSKVLFLHTGGAPSLFHYQPLQQGAPGKVAESEMA